MPYCAHADLLPRKYWYLSDAPVVLVSFLISSTAT